MKKSYIILGSIGLLIVILFFTYRSTYNTAIELQQEVKKSFSDVGTEYQRRADLIPDLVKVVKKATANEKDILTSVTNARAGISNEISNAKTPRELDNVGRKINTAFNIAFEAYPNLTSTKVIENFQVQLEGTENRIKKARQDYNESVQKYNTHIIGFFNSMLLNPVRFKELEPFSAEQGTDKHKEIDL